jgi:excisionase family DNA binding protein
MHIELDTYYESPEAACVALHISRATLHRRISSGELRTVKIGATRLIEKIPTLTEIQRGRR